MKSADGFRDSPEESGSETGIAALYVYPVKLVSAGKSVV
jgi:hypothetical protein